MTKLDELVTQINREHVYIQTHNFPDPDAIASAFGLQELLKLRGIHATICYKGKIDRYSTDKPLGGKTFYSEAVWHNTHTPTWTIP